MHFLSTKITEVTLYVIYCKQHVCIAEIGIVSVLAGRKQIPKHTHVCMMINYGT